MTIGLVIFAVGYGGHSLLEEFDEGIFNELVEKIEILTPAHFVFELTVDVIWQNI